MRVTRRIVPAVVLLCALVLAPAAQAKTRGPASSLAKVGDCSTLTYSWSGYRKAASAVFELRHNGIFVAQASSAPVSTTGSWVLPAELAEQIIPGGHHTVMGFLRDGASRAIQNSPAVWFGYC